jgi:fumarylacetoacetate (FAA) hydrolase
VTPDALGDRWQDGKLHGALAGRAQRPADFGEADAGVDMTFDFGTLIAHAGEDPRARRRHDHRLGHRLQPRRRRRPRQAVSARAAWATCIAEVRTVETLLAGEAKTPFLRHGDTVRIEMRDEKRHSIFGAIEQEVLPV